MRFKVSGAAFAFVVALASVASPQAKQINLGLTGGGALNNIKGSDISGNSAKWGFSWGGFFQFKLHNNAAIQLEALYLPKGTEGVGIFTSQGDLTLTYIELPATIAAEFGNGPWEASLYGGAAVAFEIKCDFNDGSQTSSCDTGVTSLVSTKSTQFSIPFGIRLDYVLPNGLMLGFDGRYDIGITNVFEDTGAKHRTWLLMGRIAFSAGKPL